MNIYKIVLTGGPCAGKTTIINRVKKCLEFDDYHVVLVPETASELISNGILPNCDIEHTLKFQEYILLTQSTKERVAEEYCESIRTRNIDILNGKKGIVILYDRAIIDNRAYLMHEDYNNMLKKYNYNEIATIDKYDLVIDLVSTATAKPDAYRLDGVRYETVEEAAYKDELTSSAWLLHRNLKVIKPTDYIEQKVNIVFEYIYNLLENKQKNNFTSFYVDKNSSDFSNYNNDNSRKVKIKSVCLNSINNTKMILDKRVYNECISYVMKKIELVNNNIITSENKPITYAKYKELIMKNKIEEIYESDILYFINKGNYFSLIEDANGMKIQIDENNEYEIPDNIILEKTKTLIK